MKWYMRSSATMLTFLTALLLTVQEAKAQPKPDFDFKPPISRPAYPETKGPIVLMDEAHSNSHKIIGRYLTFANLLFRDGYNVKSSTAKFTRELLKGAKILVVANAAVERSQDNGSIHDYSAFTSEEVAVVRDWVNQGGALLLIVDHFPAPAANNRLAQVFGIEFHNGYAIEPDDRGDEMVFKIKDGSLCDHPIIRGRNVEEIVTSVATFTGSAFRLRGGGEPLLVLGKSVQSFTPEVEGEIMSSTPRTSVSGWLQGATLRYGKGRIAVFGDATMFSAELAGLKKTPLGMNQPVASQNPQLLLNIVHWLSGHFGK